MAILYSVHDPAPSNNFFFFARDGVGEPVSIIPEGIEFGHRSRGAYYVDFGDEIVFGFSGSGENAWDIWVTDGTTAGTGSIADDVSTFGHPFEVAQIDAGFLLDEGTNFGNGLYLGQLGENTQELSDERAGAIVGLERTAIAMIGTELYVTDGTVSGTRLLPELGAVDDSEASNASLDFSDPLGGQLIFPSRGFEDFEQNNFVRSMWIYNETSGMAERLDELGSFHELSASAEGGGNLVFHLRVVPNTRPRDTEGGTELWLVDRVAEDPRLLIDFSDLNGTSIDSSFRESDEVDPFSDPIIVGDDVLLFARVNSRVDGIFLLRYETWLPGAPPEERIQGIAAAYRFRDDGEIPRSIEETIIHRDGKVFFKANFPGYSSVYSIELETGEITDYNILGSDLINPHPELPFLDVGVGVLVLTFDGDMYLIRDGADEAITVGTFRANYTRSINFEAAFVHDDDMIYYLNDEDLTLIGYNLETNVHTVLTESDEGARLLGTVPDSVLDAPVGVERDGTSGDDLLQGTEGNDLLTGRGGADRLVAQGGDDTLRGGDGADTLNGGAGNDLIIGGNDDTDLRDVVFAGDGNDSVDGGHGNDDLNGGNGDDTIEGGFGVDRVVGNAGNDVLTGSAFSDLVFGSDGDDFVNGGFGHDRVNGGAGADRFFHVGASGHGSDWIQDYSSDQGDMLVFGGAATRNQFQVNFTETDDAGASGVEEAFVIYRPSGQILWALIDGAAQDGIILRVSGGEFDLLA